MTDPGAPGTAADGTRDTGAPPAAAPDAAPQTAPAAVPVEPPARDRALRGATIAAVLALGAAGLALPGSLLIGGIAWLGFLWFVLAGWGAIVARIARTGDLDFGLLAALGAAGYLALAGPLIAAGVLTRPVVLALIALGAAGFAWHEMTSPIALWHRVRGGLAAARANPPLAAFAAALVALAYLRLAGAVALLDRNPWDDDLAYTPLVQRLLDAGNLIEPFSFRRLAAYGGQTALQALAGARGTLASVHLVDRGLGLGAVLLGLVGHARARRTAATWLGLIALIVITLPQTAINTASYWTGAMLFLALYRLIARDAWALVGLTAAATCTLRQNFLAPVAVLVASALVFRLAAHARASSLRAAWRAERTRWAVVAGTALAAIAAWWIAAYASSATFLYPIAGGTWNRELSLVPAVTTWPEELGFLLGSALDPLPIVTLPVLVLAAVFVTDRRPGRPLAALAIASAVGFVVVAHGLVGTEAENLWRYAFGFVIALVVALGLELGADDDQIQLVPLGRWVALAALVLQLVVERGTSARQIAAVWTDIGHAAALDRRGDGGARAARDRTRAMQAAVPAGAPLVVMLDDPALLDYRRNPIANLDTPGFAGPGGELPSFRGAEPLRGYLVDHGYRYAAFVRSDRSRYFFRRGHWLDRLFVDIELFQIMAAYTIDAIDSFAELATTTRVVYDADGLVVLDLAAPLRAATTRPAPGSEPERRAAWTRELADREQLRDAWSLATRADLRFEDGFGQLRFVDDSVDDPRWYEVSHGHQPPARGTPILPMHHRNHLRVRGTTEMRLALRAAISFNLVYTHPRLDVSLDGELLASAVADAGGRYAIEATVPRDRLTGGWHDVYLEFSTVGAPDRDPGDLRVARLLSVEWTP
ncbi:MAG TPA: hypothetical protein VHT91_33795 [Kofleriaceae bacterium]|jgi:hypothetical protein|nr:hypothetical protein [Kofleriaceae bacterium]